MEIIKQLEEYGLDEKEAKIYMAVLEFGPVSISDIAKKSSIKRPTVYHYIEGLTVKGLVHKAIRGKRILYLAEDPKRLISGLEKKKKKIEEILPNLKHIYGLSSHKPQVRFYEGIEGMRAVYREMTSTSHTIYGVFSADKYFAVFNDKDNEEFFNNIRKNAGQIKDLIEDSPVGRKHAKSIFYKGIGSPKILPKDFNLAVDLMVAGDKVAMISLVNLVGVIIENPEIADLQRNFVKFMRKSL